MDIQKQGRLGIEIRRLANEFLIRESNRLSIITVTGVDVDREAERAIISVSVLPADKEVAAMDFLKRSRSDFREFVKEKARLSRIPFFDFEIDRGEKNRQKIEDII
jgi:ribosome-binding factor A